MLFKIPIISQTLTIPSSEAEIKKFPHDVKVITVIDLKCACHECNNVPDDISQIYILPPFVPPHK